MYAPQPPQLFAVREHIAGHLKQLRAIVESPGFRKQVGALEGEKLQRVPRGFAKDHPAAEYLKFRQFIAGAEFPPALATSPKFYKTLLDRVPPGRAAHPLPERAAAEGVNAAAVCRARL